MVRRRLSRAVLAVCATAMPALRADAALIVPELNSYPTLPGGGATFAKLYLDFDGDFTQTFPSHE